MRYAEQALASVGCMKINLQRLATNEATAAIYRSLGCAVEPRISMGKVLQENVPARTAHSIHIRTEQPGDAQAFQQQA